MPANHIGFVQIQNSNTNSSIFMGNTTSSGWGTNQKEMPAVLDLNGNFNFATANFTLQSDIDVIDSTLNVPVVRSGIFLG